MSVEAMRAVFKYSRARDTVRLLLLTLADWADDHGYCWPSHRAIEKKSLLSSAGVKRAIRRAIQTGELEKMDRAHTTPALREFVGRTGFQPTNLYRIVVVDGEVKEGSERPLFSEVEEGSDRPLSTNENRGQDDTQGGVRNEVKGGSDVHLHPYDPQDDPQEDPQDLKAVALPPVPAADDEKHDDENPDDVHDRNVSVITKLVHGILDKLARFGEPNLGDVAAATKATCAELGIATGPHGELVHRAIDSALVQRRLVGKA